MRLRAGRGCSREGKISDDLSSLFEEHAGDGLEQTDAGAEGEGGRVLQQQVQMQVQQAVPPDSPHRLLQDQVQAQEQYSLRDQRDGVCGQGPPKG